MASSVRSQTPGSSSVGDYFLEFAVQLSYNLLILLILGLLLLLLWTLRRRDARRFFGVTGSESGVVDIRLSSIWVQPQGTKAVSDVSQGYQGYALTEAEYHHALRLASAVQSTFSGKVLRRVQSWVTAGRADPPLTCDIRSAPGYIDGSGDDALVVKPTEDMGRYLDLPGAVVSVGSPVYNVLTDHVLNTAGLDAHVQFVRQEISPRYFERGLLIRKFYENGEDLQVLRTTEGDEDRVHVEYALVQRICRPAKHRTIFLCAGTSTAATVAAVETLADWRSLLRRFGTTGFAIVYEIRTSTREPRPGRGPAQALEKSMHQLWATDAELVPAPKATVSTPAVSTGAAATPSTPRTDS